MILSYETVKYVSIKDSRLGLLRYSFICGIIFYVGYIELYTYGKYLMNASIHGVIRFSLQQPTIDDCDPFNGNVPCQNDFRPIRDLAYCQQSSPSLTYIGNQYPCEYYEAINAQFITETSIVILTRVKTMNQTLICGDHIDDTNNLDTCPHTYETTTEIKRTINNNDENVTQSPFYVAQSEAFTVLLDHAVSASKLCTNVATVASMSSKSVPNDDMTYTCSSSSNQYNGRLYTTNLEMCQQYVSYPDITSHEPNRPNTTTIPCYIEPNVTNGNVDYFSVDVLLRAAGINAIDDCAIGINTTNSKDSSTCPTYRDTGATIVVNIVWNDFLPHHGLVDHIIIIVSM